MRYKSLKHDIVLDTKIGLLWHPDSTRLPHAAGLAYAAELDLAGLLWRMPTIDELESVVDMTRRNPTTTLPGMVASFYWSSSAYACFTALAWVVYFGGGYSGYNGRTASFYVRCVAGPVGPLTLRRLGMSWWGIGIYIDGRRKLTKNLK